MKEEQKTDESMDQIEKEPLFGEADSRRSSGRTIPVTDGDAIERGESFSDEAEASMAAPGGDDGDDRAALVMRVAELEDRLVRSLADYDNLRKRSARQLEELSRQAVDGIILEMLDVLDNVERAEGSLASGNAAGADDSIRRGLTLIHQQLAGILSRREIESFTSLGEAFDPKQHEALMQVADAKIAGGHVALEIQRGYRQGERILRHAKVGVSSGPAGEQK